jgi:tryptophan synthase beta subunit
MSTLVFAGAGYVLGSRAGRDRYDQIVRVARRVAGSQTVQSAAGVLQAQVDDLTVRVRDLVTAKISGGSESPSPIHSANGARRP